nr:hypothetical protein [Tanacetum cinerariifolium]
GSSSRPRKALASSKSRKSLSPNGVSVKEVVETIGSSEGVGLPLAVMASFPIRRVNSPLCTSIRARPVFKKHLPRIKGTQGSGSKSTTTKSAGKWNIPTLTETSLAIPIGLETERSASSRVMQVGVSFGSDNSFHTESGMRFMLEPISANARHSSILGNSQGMRNLSGSPSFLGNLFRMTAKQCSFIGVRAISLSFSLFLIRALRVEANLGMVLERL